MTSNLGNPVYSCSLGFIPMRESASNKSQQISQLLYGEDYKVLHSDKDWHFIESIYDGYQGWIFTRIHFSKVNNHKLNRLNQNMSPNDFELLEFHPLRLAVTKKSIPYGSIVKISEGNTTKPELIRTAESYLGTPYLWGGRSEFGIDCSGLTQIVFAQMGIHLLRDAYQQATQGQEVIGIENAQIGDLIFFTETSAESISHVGIYYGHNQIIHASDVVRINHLNENGIYNVEISQVVLKIAKITRFPIS